MMLIMFARAPASDAAYWPGRRWLAALDAVAWPAIALVLLSRIPGQTGLIAPIACAICGVNALLRLQTALWQNHRYRFTTWRGARVLLALLLIAAALKLVLAWR